MPQPIPTHSPTARIEHRFFGLAAGLMLLTVLIGFAPTYFLQPFLASPETPPLGVGVHLHAILFSAWELLRAGDWSGAEMEADAFRARLASRDGNARLQAELWNRAVRRAGDVSEQLGVLLGLARRWQRQSKQLPLLARLAQRRPADRVLLESWRRAGIAARQSEAVQRACAALLTAGVDTPDVRNDFAASALLRRTDLERAMQLALANHTAAPKNGDYAATYATALRVTGRAADGLRILDALPATERIREQVELVRAACLAALGRKEEARAIALRLSQGRWFPEEETMLAQLRTGG